MTKISNNLGIYVHIPFCMKKCRYCDFTSFSEVDTNMYKAYVERLCLEIKQKKKPSDDEYTVDTIYIGGGTPSVLPPSYIYQILKSLRKNYNVADDAEISIEVNPGTVSSFSLSSYLEHGVNRLSIGAQSFNDGVLNFLDRIHEVSDVMKTFENARNAGFSNISIDLMFGIPNQSLTMWLDDLKMAVLLDPEHISHYSLQIEEDTPLYEDWSKGMIEQLDEDIDRDMYHKTVATLQSAGYKRYEISNSAKPNYESKHNLKYWNMDDYLGFGLSAHSYMRGKRFANTDSLNEYLSAKDINEFENFYHKNTAEEELGEYIFLGLRKSEGIDLFEFNDKFKTDFWKLYGPKTKDLIRSGLLENKETKLKLTELGFDLANTVFCEYV